jgi:hypothetical protein
VAPGIADDVEAGDPPLAHAVDAELALQSVPSGVASRWRGKGFADEGQFWELWCATEVLAKLADVPVVVLVRRGPVTTSPAHRGHLEVQWLVQRMGELVVVHGLSWATTTPEVT